MDTIKDRLIKANSILDDKSKKLEELETEKKDIIQRFKMSTDKERVGIKIEMKESEAKFKKLFEEVSVLGEKINKLKKTYC